MNDLVPEYEGMDLYEAREKIVERLQREGYLVKIEDYTHNVGKCYRCHHTIEPHISEQWFVSMKDLAKRAADAVRNDEVKFVPKRYEKMYTEIEKKYDGILIRNWESYAWLKQHEYQKEIRSDYNL